MSQFLPQKAFSQVDLRLTFAQRKKVSYFLLFLLTSQTSPVNTKAAKKAPGKNMVTLFW